MDGCFTQVGPVVAEDRKTAEQLVTAALRNCTGPVLMDVPHHDPKWLEWLGQKGFREQRPFIRMFRGSNHAPGRPEKQFAILGPEFG